MIKTIRAKLTFGYALLLVLAVIIGALGLGNATLIKDSSALNEHTRQVLKEVADIRETMTNIETGQRGFVITGYERYLEPHTVGVDAIEDQFDAVLARTSDNPAQTTRLNELKGLYQTWLNKHIDPTIELRRAFDRQEMDYASFLEQFVQLSGKPLMDQMRAKIEEIRIIELKLLQERKAAADSAYTTALVSVGGALLLAIVVGVIASMSLSGLLNRKLNAANTHIQALANGQLNSRIQAEGDDEIDRLLTGLSKAQANLKKLIEGIRNSALELSSSATQVKESSSAMSNAGVEQADATSSMAAAVEELTVSISQISENSNDATSTAGTAKRNAESGAQTLANVVQGIQRIAQSVQQSASAVQSLEKQSSEISEIVSTITEIADRTNLLALNAAIEAARAGEQGRGFAVVADEVRKLAEQTKGSTDRISGMVQNIQNITLGAVQSMDSSVVLVQEGLSQADVVNATIEKIKADSDRVSEAIAAIAVSMKEQSNVSIEISRNVERVAQMTEENTAAARQNTQVAEHLASVSDSLMSSVRVFRTE
ncbi:methyl-accepting chemotaxis protein [Limnobacter sp.]|uniref:methyl-accepting chemotaxis protein n=1 Tax=Limnobacter sp. TaxID=2003368 RepID=UPI00351580DE